MIVPLRWPHRRWLVLYPGAPVVRAPAAWRWGGRYFLGFARWKLDAAALRKAFWCAW